MNTRISFFIFSFFIILANVLFERQIVFVDFKIRLLAAEFFFQINNLSFRIFLYMSGSTFQIIFLRFSLLSQFLLKLGISVDRLLNFVKKFWRLRLKILHIILPFFLCYEYLSLTLNFFGVNFNRKLGFIQILSFSFLFD